MARDYKPTSRKPKSSGKGSVFFSGFLLGLVVGVGASLGVVVFVKGGESPFTAPPPKTVMPAPTAPQASLDAPETQTNRFDFYKILPGNESQVTEQEMLKSMEEQQKSAERPVQESYYLQVGAFQTEQEADNVKAKLALLGLEAVVQTANVPDKGIWHRVRVGPYTNLDQINNARAELTLNGFSADLIKVNNNTPDQ